MKHKCSKCNIKKDNSGFSKNSKTKNGLQAWCKLCASKSAKQHYEKNEDYHQNKNKEWSKLNATYNKKRNKEWMTDNKEKRKQYKKEYRKDNRDAINAYKRKRLKKLMKDPKFKLESNLRKRLYRCIKKIKNNPLENKSITKENRKLIGCPIQELQIYLENMFQSNMSWDNYGEWHVDHIIPISHFDLTKLQDVQKCFHYSNLQPLWAMDNILKGDKLIKQT